MATRLELPVLLFRSPKPHFRFRRFGLKSLDSLNQQIHLERKHNFCSSEPGPMLYNFLWL
jgi:hypothetical protein